MPQRVIKQPNGLLALFSSIVDNLLVYDCTPDEMFGFLTTEYRAPFTPDQARWKIDQGARDMIYGENNTGDGRWRWDDDMFHALIVHWHDESERATLFGILAECGMNSDEITRWCGLAERAVHELDTTDMTDIHARFED